MPSFRYSGQPSGAAASARALRYRGDCGDYVDPTFVARDPILLNTQTVLASHPERAPVHIVHRIEQLRPIRLGETLQMHGRVSGIGDHPKGWILTTIWEYRDAAGEIVFVVTPVVLMIDPERSGNGGKGGSGRMTDGEETRLRRSPASTAHRRRRLAIARGAPTKFTSIWKLRKVLAFERRSSRVIRPSIF